MVCDISSTADYYVSIPRTAPPRIPTRGAVAGMSRSFFSHRVVQCLSFLVAPHRGSGEELFILLLICPVWREIRAVRGFCFWGIVWRLNALRGIAGRFRCLAGYKSVITRFATPNTFKRSISAPRKMQCVICQTENSYTLRVHCIQKSHTKFV